MLSRFPDFRVSGEAWLQSRAVIETHSDVDCIAHLAVTPVYRAQHTGVLGGCAEYVRGSGGGGVK